MNHLPDPFGLGAAAIQEIAEQFAVKTKLASARHEALFKPFDEELSDEERFALQFLYAFMPLSDMANYDGSLFLNHVRSALRIRRETPWGSRISDIDFLYFVLPYRVNNENIEDIRELLFAELYPRVKSLSMTEAVLETNHWCHEKANYNGNDIRTVSPLTLIRTALGRCGEQSSLAVAALRSIGIPARQVYTPRWAHCDSNHAWVEAWADGDWQYFGACEPDPVLNRGWFRQPARRAMLVHTRVPARYAGDEPVTFSSSWLTELNLLHRYSPGKTIVVQVQDESGKPAKANVSFQLYNYAELSTIVSLDTDDNGEASITLGLGDVWIHACGDKGFGFAKLDAAREDSAVITLKDMIEPVTLEFTMAPPIELPDFEDTISDEVKAAHDQRVREGAAIRTEYEATFLQEQQAVKLAKELALPPERVWDMLKKARGNSHEIARFLTGYAPAHGEWTLLLLESMNEKDLTDTFIPTLEDYLLRSLPFRSELDPSIFVRYVMCPRFHYEMLGAYRAVFQTDIPTEKQALFRSSPDRLSEWIDSWFETTEDFNFYKGMSIPLGSFRLQKGDRLSRDIMFAAIARSIGIPARLEPSDQRPQYMQNGEWIDAVFNSDRQTAALDGVSDDRGQTNNSSRPESKEPQTLAEQSGFIRLNRAADAEEEPRYYGNFTLSRLVDGKFKTLSFEFGSTELENNPLEALPGHYRLTTGTRLPDGTALVRLHEFKVSPGETINELIMLRPATAAAEAIASLQSDIRLDQPGGEVWQLDENLQLGPVVLAWIEPDREPSKHLLRELGELREQLDGLGSAIALLIGASKWSAVGALPDLATLPDAVSIIQDDDAYSGLGALLAALPAGRQTGDDASGYPADASAASFPIVAIIDEQRTIRYFSSGYKLGIGREIARTLQQL